jgi:hypothetical protein
VENRLDNHQSVTVNGHESLWEAASLAKVKRVVFVSALGVDRSYPIPWFDGKLQAERSLAKSGLDHVILRPTPFTSNFARWARLSAKQGAVLLPGSGSAAIAPISSRDLALYSISAMDPSVTSGRVICLSGVEVSTGRELMVAARSGMSVSGQVLFAGSSFSKIGSRLAQLAGHRWRHHFMTVNTWLANEFVVDMSAIVNEFGIVGLPVNQALDEDHARYDRLDDPELGSVGIVYRRFNANIYSPGTVDIEDLPTGPRRYDV